MTRVQNTQAEYDARRSVIENEWQIDVAAAMAAHREAGDRTSLGKAVAAADAKRNAALAEVTRRMGLGLPAADETDHDKIVDGIVAEEKE
jgi:hypothetical protein